jgi:hypothetical protein
LVDGEQARQRVQQPGVSQYQAPQKLHRPLQITHSATPYTASAKPKPRSQKKLSQNVKLATQDSERSMAIDPEKVIRIDDDDFQDF